MALGNPKEKVPLAQEDRGHPHETQTQSIALSQGLLNDKGTPGQSVEKSVDSALGQTGPFGDLRDTQASCFILEAGKHIHDAINQPQG